MSTFERVYAAWRPALDAMMQSVAFQKMADGTLTEEEYRAILRQVFHQVREHPQALGIFTSRLRGDRRREMVKTLLKHAVSEADHDELAVADLATMGEDVSGIRTERPLPSTAAIVAFMHYQLEHENPIGFLGYLFHLEFTPTAIGSSMVRALKSAGIPEQALSFIRDHADIDVGHNKLMELYVEELVQSEVDLEAVSFVARATAHLYGHMFNDAIATRTLPVGRASQTLRAHARVTADRISDFKFN